MSTDSDMIRNVVECALLAAGEPVSVERLLMLFDDGDGVDRAVLREALARLETDYEGRGLELREVASGYRIQVRAQLAPWISRLWEQRPPKYSRALLETLALIAYQQPVTRGDIEQVRGVSVSSNIIKTMLDRDWIRIVGHRDVPGKPALYGTTRAFLDYFDLRSLDKLPPLSELRDLSRINEELGFEAEDGAESDASPELPDGDEDTVADVVPLRAVLGQFDPVEENVADDLDADAPSPDVAMPDVRSEDEDGAVVEGEADEAEPELDPGSEADGSSFDDDDESRRS